MNSSLERAAVPGLEPADHGTLTALNQASEGRTPVRILAQLAPDPGAPPVGYTVMTGEDVTLSLVASGDWLGIDGRWCLVVECTSVNGWVSVQTAHGHSSIRGAGYMDVRVHLARDIDLEGVEE